MESSPRCHSWFYLKSKILKSNVEQEENAKQEEKTQHASFCFSVLIRAAESESRILLSVDSDTAGVQHHYIIRKKNIKTCRDII